LYVGVVKAVNTTTAGEYIIFRAIFHSSVADLTSNALTLTGAQFSSNVADNEDGGIVLAVRASNLKLIGAQFETAVAGNITQRRPIRANQDSKIEILLGCIDTSEVFHRGRVRKDNWNSLPGKVPLQVRQNPAGIQPRREKHSDPVVPPHNKLHRNSRRDDSDRVACHHPRPRRVRRTIRDIVVDGID
jgi:hypothetical protein